MIAPWPVGLHVSGRGSTMTAEPPSTAQLSALVVARLTERGETVACAESLTAGLVSAAVADTPGASLVLRGGVVAYAADVKAGVLGLDPALLEERGTVDPAVARAMAEGVRALMDSTWGVATTGVAGPGAAEGKPAGTVHVAVAGPQGTRDVELALTGGRDDVRSGTVRSALALLADGLGPSAEVSDPAGATPRV